MLVLFVDSGCTRFAVMGETLQTDLVGWSLWSLGPSPQPPNVAPPLCLPHLSAMVHGPAHGSLPIPLEGFPKQQGLLTYWTCIPITTRSWTALNRCSRTQSRCCHHPPLTTVTTSPALELDIELFFFFWLSLPFFLHSIEEETWRITMSWWSEHFTLQDATCCISAIKALSKVEITLKALWLSELWVAELYSTSVMH